MVDNNGLSIWLTIAGLAEGILAGMFLFLWAGITKLRDDVRKDIDATNESLEKKAGELRQGTQILASEVHVFESKSADHRAKMQERIGQLPTRDDLKAARQEMREDLKAMEARILGGIRSIPRM